MKVEAKNQSRSDRQFLLITGGLSLVVLAKMLLVDWLAGNGKTYKSVSDEVELVPIVDRVGGDQKYEQSGYYLVMFGDSVSYRLIISQLSC